MGVADARLSPPDREIHPYRGVFSRQSSGVQKVADTDLRTLPRSAKQPRHPRRLPTYHARVLSRTSYASEPSLGGAPPPLLPRRVASDRRAASLSRGIYRGTIYVVHHIILRSSAENTLEISRTISYIPPLCRIRARENLSPFGGKREKRESERGGNRRGRLYTRYSRRGRWILLP